MYLTTDVKKNILTKHGKTGTDTGLSEGQIALFTHRIQHLAEHMKQNKKDMRTKRSLVGLVGQRRKLLDYLKERDITRYRAILKELNLRK